MGGDDDVEDSNPPPSDDELDEVDRLRTEVDDFAARLRVAGAGLLVLGLVIAIYVVAAHLV